VEQRSTCSPWKGPHAGAGGCLKEAVILWGPHAGAGSCQELRTHGQRSPHWSRFAGRACDPVGDPRWSSLFLKDCTSWEGPTLWQFVKNCSLWEGPMLEKFVENCLLWERPHTGAGKSVRSPPPERQGVAETSCHEQTTIPFPRTPALLGGRRERNGSEVEPRTREGWGEAVLRVSFIFSLSYSDLIDDELNSLLSPGSICFVRGSYW